MTGEMLTIIFGGVGSAATGIGFAVRYVVNRFDSRIAALEESMKRADAREKVLYRRITDLEHTMLKSDLDLPQTPGWPL